MTRTTTGVPFYWKVHTWAYRFAGGRGFLALLSPSGEVTRVYQGDQGGDGLVSSEVRALLDTEARWIFLDPVDGPAATWLAWKGVPPGALDALVGEPLGPDVLDSFCMMF